MKKLIAMLLAVVLVASMAACGNNAGTAGDTQPKVEVPATALEILEKVWSSYTDDEKFPVFGGNQNENAVMDAPAKFDLTDTDGLTYTLLVPAEQAANIDDAASMIHMMNANTFSSAVFHVKGDVKAFAEAMYTAVSGNRWMCGMPEKLLVTIVGGEYVLVAFGLNDAMTPFQTKLAAAYPAAEQLYLADLDR